MNTRSELERIVGDWLADRVTEPAPGGLPAALERVRETQQRQSWLRRWFGRWTRGSLATTEPLVRGETRMLGVSGSLTVVTAVILGALLLHGGDRGGRVPGVSPGSTVVVAQDGSGDFETIRDAVAAVVDGDVIRVRPGTYEEAVSITSDITLQGDGSPDDIIIRTPPASRTMETDDSSDRPFAAIELRGSDATISGLTVLSPPDLPALLVDGGSSTLAGLVIGSNGASSADWGVLFVGGSTARLIDSSAMGYVAVRDGAGPTIERNTFSANILSIDGPGTTTLRGNTFLDGAGISLTGALGVVEANHLTGGSIGVDVGSQITIEGNTVRAFQGRAGDGAINVRDVGSHARIVGNTVTDSVFGIRVVNGATASIEGNELVGNEVGISVTAPSVTVAANRIIGNRTGIGVGAGAGQPAIVDNRIESNAVGLSISSPSVEPALSGNELCGNEVDVRVIGRAVMPPDGIEVCAEGIPPTSE